MKLPEPVAWMDRDGDVYKETPELSRAPHQKLFTESQLRELLAQQTNQLKQLQEQNTYLDRVASEIQNTCEKQERKLEQQKLVMELALKCLSCIVMFEDGEIDGVVVLLKDALK